MDGKDTTMKRCTYMGAVAGTSMFLGIWPVARMFPPLGPAMPAAAVAAHYRDLLLYVHPNPPGPCARRAWRAVFHTVAFRPDWPYAQRCADGGQRRLLASRRPAVDRPLRPSVSAGKEAPATLPILRSRFLLVGREFMELRHAPPLLLWLFQGWVVAVCAMLLLLFLI
ncbi:hypothetical protein [Novosphingobium sp. BL-52-GroH]|uniref:hypothetical protein n=1 Tax=Novosphingobium sp. BL-52-GroH TaxID=3349877 RepID=UPI00384E7DE6